MALAEHETRPAATAGSRLEGWCRFSEAIEAFSPTILTKPPPVLRTCDAQIAT